MGVCWYCYWGWPKPVADIFAEFIEELDGDEGPLVFGPSHIVWSDENFEDEHIEWCLRETCGPGWRYVYKDYDDEQLQIVKRSLEKLLSIPEEIRCPVPDYDGEHPENYPPPADMMMSQKLR